ncbi:MAG: insulinase family protein [Deltaproteobacteria bacterium]|nr:insulinase family protein [Deltaproteobacteria bacterium]
MFTGNSFFRHFRQRLLLLVIALGVCSFWYHPVSEGAETGEANLSETGPPVFESQWIDRVLPSKGNDLFVVLKNGMTVLIRESYASNVVACQVLVKTGSIYEGSRMEGGISHYLEHVVSGGTTSTLTESEIKKRVQAIGGATNAYTSYERTLYFINTTRIHFTEAITLLLSYVTDCQFNETEYQREKPVIIQEFQMEENSPSRQLWSLFMKTAYRNHPVRYPIIGERAIFLKMDKEDLRSHYLRWYTPENMVVTVAGNVKKETALKTIIDFAGPLERAVNPPYVLPREPPQLSPRSVEKSLPMARLAQTQIGFRTVRLTDPDLYPLDVLAVILGNGRTSRLYKKVRDQKGLVLSISAGSWTPTFVDGQFIISMDLSYENLSKALDAVWEELRDVQTNLVSAQALERAKNKVVADYIFSQESIQSQARQVSADWVATGDPYFSEAYVSKIKEVTVEEVRRVAQKYFKKEKMTLAVVKPPQAVSRTPEALASPSASGTQIERIILPNQMTLLLKRNPAAPIVTLKFFVKGGLRFEPPDKPGLSQFMAALLTKGTKNRSKIEIAQTLEDVGGSISSSSGYNLVSISASTLQEHFDTALDLLADVVLNPTFPAEEIEKQRKETLLAIPRLDEQWTNEITRLFKTHYYRRHPYKNDVLGTLASVESLSEQDIRRFYESIMLPNNAVLAIFGDIDPKTVVPKVEKVFSYFKPDTLQKPLIEIETHNIFEDKYFEKSNDKTSAAILVGYNGLTLSDKDAPVVDVIDAIISGIGYPSGWLHDALRGGNVSLVYYVHAYPAFGIDGGYFGVITQTTVENYDEVLRIILDKMALIQKKKVDDETLRRAKDMCITMHELGLETISSQASSAGINEILGRGSDYDTRYPALIQKVTNSDARRVAQKLFSHHLIVATKPSCKD